MYASKNTLYKTNINVFMHILNLLTILCTLYPYVFVYDLRTMFEFSTVLSLILRFETFIKITAGF